MIFFRAQIFLSKKHRPQAYSKACNLSNLCPNFMFIFHIQSVGPAPIKTVVKDEGEMGGKGYSHGMKWSRERERRERER
mgnify:CR=1 FL=1